MIGRVVEPESVLAAFDPTKPNIARVYDYLLGGKDNFAADRALGNQIIASLPTVQVGVRAQREVLGRVVSYLVGEAVVGQLIDIGSGLPTAESVHEVAQRIDPRTRVVYVDNDPVVLAHARALLADNPRTIVIEGDLRSPQHIVNHPDARGHLDSEQPHELMALLRGALPAGSYVFIHHLVDSGDPAIADVQAALRRGLGRGQFRDWDQIRGLFDGFELVEPGLVLVPDWRPRGGTLRAEHHPVLRLACVGVARKP